MVTGTTPFEGESPYVIMNARVTGDPPAPRKVKPEVSPAVEEIILHALERDPKLRYETAGAMKKDLENLGSVAITDRAHRLRAPQPWSGKRARWKLIVGIVLVELAVLAYAIYYFRHRH